MPLIEIWNNVIHYPTFYSANVFPDAIKGKILHRVSTPELYGMKQWTTHVYKNEISPVLNHAKKRCKNDDWLAFVREREQTDR